MVPEAMFKWLPPCLAAIAIVFATRVFSNQATLPLALIATALGFYVLMWAFGISMSEATAAPLLLGPFQEGGFLNGVDPSLAGRADWSHLFPGTGNSYSRGNLTHCNDTNASGLELALKRDFDISREAQGNGNCEYSGRQSVVFRAITYWVN